MIQFMDGPAEGWCLRLARAPAYLRVALTGEGDDAMADALDQLWDTPTPGERLVAYFRGAPALGGFIDYCDQAARRRGELFLDAEYYVVSDQPSDAVMRDAIRWQQWCLDRRDIVGGLFEAVKP